jgi:hypothetical protein
MAVCLVVGAGIAVVVELTEVGPRPIEVDQTKLKEGLAAPALVAPQPVHPHQMAAQPLAPRVRFEPNLGQAAPDVSFLSRSRDQTLYLKAGEVELVLGASPSAEGAVETAAYPSTLTIDLEGADRSAEIVGLERRKGVSNYYIGDRAAWVEAVPHYAGAQYESAYRGIDMRFYGTEGALEFDFVVAPGADPNDIHLRFRGAESLGLDKEGNLRIQTAAGHVVQRRPIIYQVIGGSRRGIAGGYTLEDENSSGTTQLVTFDLGPYDPDHTLVIDPVLDYATYLGGSNAEIGVKIAVSDDGGVFVAGLTKSSDFPTHMAAQPNFATGTYDAFVTRMTPDLSDVIYSTYLGGTGSEQPVGGIAVDEAGNAYIAGRTTSANFPTTTGAFDTTCGTDGFCNSMSDAFLTKLDASGALVYSTFIGGSGHETGGSPGVDAAGNMFLSGSTESSDFPTLNAAQPAFAGASDAFLLTMNPAGTALGWSTYLGGNGFDDAPSVEALTSGGLYIFGTTESTDLPTTAGAVDPDCGTDGTCNSGFPSFHPQADFLVARFTGAGALSYCTYLGGSYIEVHGGLAVDFLGNAYVAGSTISSDFPTEKAYQGAGGGNGDTVLAKLNTTGTALLFSTYFGGSGFEDSAVVALDAGGVVHLAGRTDSTDFPTLTAFQPTLNGTSGDAFVAGFNGSGQTLLYSTYLGGTDLDIPTSIVAPSPDVLYVAGNTASSDFPTSPRAYQPALNGADDDAWIARLGRYLKAFVAEETGSAEMPLGAAREIASKRRSPFWRR